MLGRREFPKAWNSRHTEREKDEAESILSHFSFLEYRHLFAILNFELRETISTRAFELTTALFPVDLSCSPLILTLANKTFSYEQGVTGDAGPQF